MAVATGAYFLNTAKSLYKIILWAVGSAVPLSLLSKFINLDSPLREILVFGPAGIGLLMAPVGMYYILKSYQLREQNKKQKLVYLIGLGLINALGLMLVYVMLTKGTEALYQ